MNKKIIIAGGDLMTYKLALQRSDEVIIIYHLQVAKGFARVYVT